VSEKKLFSGKNRACLLFPKKNRSLIKLVRTVFPQLSKALGHERVQFTLVGLISGIKIEAFFSRADPGAKRRKKNIVQKQLPSSKSKPFPKESDRVLNPY
jgi:hypothetical protein